MTQLLPILVVFALQAPSADTFRATDWKPMFVEQKDLKLEESTVALLTHSSCKFDPLAATGPGVRRVVRTMKSRQLPVLYLHDRYNSSNPPWMYLYDDWNPTAYISSDIGHISLDLKGVTHVICMGGYYGQCERATVSDTVRQWTNGDRKHDLRLTQIVDATFTVAQHVNWEDPYRESVRHQMYKVLRKRHADAVLSVDDVLEKIDGEGAVFDFLQRQLPHVSASVNIVLDVFGEQITLQRTTIRRKISNDDAPPESGESEQSTSPTLTFAFRRSDDFLKFDPPEIDEEAPLRWVRRSGSRFISDSASSRVSSSAATVISSPITSPVYSDGKVIRVIEFTDQPSPSSNIIPGFSP